jgi:archaellum biogenesis ATPase FlaH
MIGLHRTISKEFRKICVVTVHNPFPVLVRKFQEEGINCSNYRFIDCISAKNMAVKDSEQCIYISSPLALTELAIAMEKIRTTHQMDLLILDNISSLLVYNNESAVLRFLHAMMTKLRRANVTTICPILEEEGKREEFMADLSLFADAVTKFR